MRTFAATQPTMLHAVGLDLGQQQDPTALALLEWPRPVAGPFGETPPPPAYQVRTLKRWHLGTPYTDIVAGLVKFFEMPEVAGAVLVMDETGVGRPVVEMVRDGLVRARSRCGGLVAVTITGGHALSHVGEGVWHVPKKTLVGVLQVLLQARRLQVAPDQAEAQTLVKEFQNFKVKVTAAGNEQFEAWRARDHDDLVLAVALACWAAETLNWYTPADDGPLYIVA